MLTTVAGVHGSKMLTTERPSFVRKNTRAADVWTECRTGRRGTLRTTQRGITPVESGTATSAVDASSDAETGSPDLKDRSAMRRGSRSG